MVVWTIVAVVVIAAGIYFYSKSTAKAPAAPVNPPATGGVAGGIAPAAHEEER